MAIHSSLHNIHSTTQYNLPEGQGWSESDVQRFWAKVKTGGPGGCWLWTASRMDAYGHGQFTRSVAGKQRHLYAHRVVWELTVGPIPAGQVVCHRCDVPECVNPQHLFLGTQQDNLNDARQKGRLIDGMGARKLSDAAYREILATPYAHGSGIALARKHGVDKQTISRIRNGHQGSTYRRTQRPTEALSFERVPHVLLPVKGEVR